MSASTISKLLAAVLAMACSGCTLLVQGRAQEVEFTSDPTGATFTVAGENHVTPTKIPVPKNDYDIPFQRAGYKDASFELKRRMSAWFWGSLAMGVIGSVVDITTGAWQEFDTTKVHVVLEPLPGTQRELPLSITSDPTGAEILINDVSYGRTPRDFSLPWRNDEREKKVTIRMAGYHPKNQALPRSESKIHVVLEAIPVTVAVRFVSVPPGAEVRLEGRRLGQTPLSSDLLWKPGDKPRPVEVVLEGYHLEKREIAPAARDLAVELREIVEEIALPLKIEPAGAKVVVDGKALPEGAKSVTLAWSVSKSRHTVAVTHPGFSAKTVEVKRAAAAAPLEVRLTPSLPGTP